MSKKLDVKTAEEIIKNLKKMKKDDCIEIINKYGIDTGLDEDDYDDLSDKDMRIALEDELELVIEDLQTRDKDDDDDIEDDEDQEDEEDQKDDEEVKVEKPKKAIKKIQDNKNVKPITKKVKNKVVEKDDEDEDDEEETKPLKDVKGKKEKPKKTIVEKVEEDNEEETKPVQKVKKTRDITKQPRPNAKIERGESLELVDEDGNPLYINVSNPCTIVESDIHIKMKIEDKIINALDDGRYITFAYKGQWFDVIRKYVKYDDNMVNYKVGKYNKEILEKIVESIKEGVQIKTDYSLIKYQTKEKEVKEEEEVKSSKPKKAKK